ncbi:MAG: hypothetical protein EZS28_028151, partial [Streblomastix strix]
MFPQILSQVTLGLSEQVLIRGKFMKEEQKLPPGTIELIKISSMMGTTMQIISQINKFESNCYQYTDQRSEHRDMEEKESKTYISGIIYLRERDQSNRSIRKRISRCCPVKTLLSWTAQREKDSITHDQIWHNLSKKVPATSQYFSYQLTNIIRRAGVRSPYTDPTIRHAMMTRLRAAGATQPEVNAFTRHAISSNIVNVYYSKPIERDLSALLVLNEESYIFKISLFLFIGSDPFQGPTVFQQTMEIYYYYSGYMQQPSLAKICIEQIEEEGQKARIFPQKNVIPPLPPLSQQIQINKSCKQVIQIPKFLHSLTVLSSFKLGTQFSKKIDKQRLEVRHWSRECLDRIQQNGDEYDQTELVNNEYGRVICISLSTAGGIGEEEDYAICKLLIHINNFLTQIHEGRNDYQPSFQPLPLLARMTEEQIEEEGANEEVEAQMINYGHKYCNIKYYAKYAKAVIL